MRRTLIYLLILFSIFSCNTNQKVSNQKSQTTDKSTEKWQLSEFMIHTYGVLHGADLKEDEAIIKVLVEANFNSLGAPLNRLELCRKYGLKVLIPHPGVENAAKLVGDSTVWGYDIIDEPISLDQIFAVAESIKIYRKADPTHPGYVNLNQKGGDWIRFFIDTVNPDVLSYDDYQWWYGGVYEWFAGTPVHFVKLEQHRDAAHWKRAFRSLHGGKSMSRETSLEKISAIMILLQITRLKFARVFTQVLRMA